MGKYCLKMALVLILIFCFNGLQAQTSHSKLNQVELMKKFTGLWKSDFAKDTTEFWEAKPYGNGLEAYFKDVTKGKITLEGKQLWGYDTKLDKFIYSTLIPGMDIDIGTLWFTSQNKYVGVPYNDVLKPEKATSRVEGEFTSPDVYVESKIVNNKKISSNTFKLVK